mgnify:CR=1 FL=1
MDLLPLLWWLAVGHVVSDFVLQTDFMSQAKDPKQGSTIYYGGIQVSRKRVGPWWLWMGAHGILNGAVTALILGVWWVGPIEALHHACIDWCKCTGRLGFWADQLNHAFMKGVLLYLVLNLGGV